MAVREGLQLGGGGVWPCLLYEKYTYIFTEGKNKTKLQPEWKMEKLGIHSLTNQ